MAIKKLPFTKSQIEAIIKKHPTPFHIYDEQAIRENARRLIAAFSWVENFKEYFAVKATPNPYIMKILNEEGFGADCSSLTELLLAEKVGITGEEIMFSSNDTPAREFVKARELSAIINLDDISHIDFLERHAGIPEVISFRYNPGALRGGSTIMGTPEESKYGFTREQLFRGYEIVREKGTRRFGIHTFIISNELNRSYFVETARMLFELAIALKREIDIRLDFVNLSGGIGIPYKPDEESVDLLKLSEEIKIAYDEMIVPNGLHPMGIYMECGRMITGPYGYLVSTVLHMKDIYKQHVGLDACMAHLMRPAIYNAYHHITVMGKENMPHDHLYDVTGSLCESNDKFAIDRNLPRIDIGDIVVIHDAGAHGHAMGFNYNGKLRSAELLLKPDGGAELIRRAESVEDYFATLDFSRL